MRWKTVSVALNLAGFMLLLATLALVYLWPQHLANLGLDGELGRVLLMQEISFLLLLGAFQTNLSLGWQRASLAMSFVVLAEATLIALL